MLSMAVTRELGTRIELVSMDPHFHDITIALYRQDQTGHPKYLVYSYSNLAGCPERIASIRSAMATLGQLEQDGDLLRFACGSAHQAAVRRTFLETAKLASGSANVPKPLTVMDKKSGETLRQQVWEQAGIESRPTDQKTEKRRESTPWWAAW